VLIDFTRNQRQSIAALHILSLYDARNVTHLAGHGGLASITITEEQAVVMAEMAKAFVRIEYKLNAVLAPPSGK
jgi:hypothetical protein